MPVRDDFIFVVRYLECDEDKGRFEERPGKVAKACQKNMSWAASYCIRWWCCIGACDVYPLNMEYR